MESIMKKDVLLALKGLQFSLDEAQNETALETITPAEYYKRGGSHYLIYDEVMEGFTDTTKSIIKFQENRLELTKKGLVNVHMLFEENRKNMSSYHTPFGNIMIGIDTASIKCMEEEENIRVEVNYELEVNYEHLADCKIEMKVCPRDKGQTFISTAES